MSSLNLFPPQQEVIEYGFLETGFHCLLNMATGSGKTFLAELAIKKCLERGFRTIYLTPLKALADEKYESWKKHFGGQNIGLFTGDVIGGPSRKMPCSYKTAQIYIMTPERLDACMRNWRAHWGWIPEIDLLVVDEFHLLSDPHRGPRLEGTITRLTRLNPFARILGLSATMSNVEQLSDWLQGVCYRSQWRQVPLKKRIARFTKLKDKLPLLIEEVAACAAGGGKSLVFANSRSRAQNLAQALRENGLKAQHHHAGLKHEVRKKVEISFRSGEIDVLVATSTLEMGLNLPARQVIIYDSYAFDGAGFSPLPVWSFIQRAGRAGRPGLDPSGEAVLFLPKWAGGAEKYIREESEPITSKLNSSRAMAEQILVELYAGYSKNREHLSDGFLPLTLHKHQHPGADLTNVINRMILADMIAIKSEDTAQNSQQTTLVPTRLGRLAVKLMFMPATVKLIKDFYLKIGRPYFFDMLLMATLTGDCSPVLPANYEDLEALMEIVQPAPSVILDLSLEKLQKVTEECPSTLRVLAAVKMAALCYALTRNRCIEELAQKFDLYPADIEMLKNNVVRLLDGMSAIFKSLDKADSCDDDTGDTSDIHSPGQLCRRLSAMFYYELDDQSVILTYIPGVGGKLARVLTGHGYETLQELSQLKPNALTGIPGIGLKLAQKIIAGAQEVLKNNLDLTYAEKEIETDLNVRTVKTSICPYRLRRSLELRLKGHDGKYYYVTGGREDHILIRSSEGFSCDCQDFLKRQQHCKHILAVRHALQDREVCALIKKIKEDKNHSLREALPSLWFSMSNPDSNLKEAR